MVEKYVKIQNLRQAKKDEEVCAIYPNPIDNVSGKKTDDKMKIAEKDAKDGKCRLVVRREFQSLEQAGVGTNFKRKQKAVRKLMDRNFNQNDILKIMSDPLVIKALEDGKDIEEIIA